MAGRASFTAEDARQIGEDIGIDWSSAPFDVEQFQTRLDVELEHGARDPATDVTGDDPTVTGKIALAHLNEFPDYYTRLEAMEEQGEARPWNRRPAAPRGGERSASAGTDPGGVGPVCCLGQDVRHERGLSGSRAIGSSCQSLGSATSTSIECEGGSDSACMVV
jgi:hypothetical protein